MRRNPRRPAEDLIEDVVILDEQEQDNVIQSLSTENKLANLAFRRVIAGLCILPGFAIAFVTRPDNLLLSLLSISSLTATAVTLLYLADEAIDEWDGPLVRYLPMLNGILAGVIVLVSYMRTNKNDAHSGVSAWLNLYCTPALMHLLSIMIRTVSTAAARAIADLEKKKYKGYKGV